MHDPTGGRFAHQGKHGLRHNQGAEKIRTECALHRFQFNYTGKSISFQIRDSRVVDENVEMVKIFAYPRCRSLHAYLSIHIQLNKSRVNLLVREFCCCFTAKLGVTRSEYHRMTSFPEFAGDFEPYPFVRPRYENYPAIGLLHGDPP